MSARSRRQKNLQTLHRRKISAQRERTLSAREICRKVNISTILPTPRAKISAMPSSPRARLLTAGAKPRAYNRGQILYRAAEMLQNRASELVNEIARSTNVSAAKAKREVTLAIDRLVHFAGWTDKYQQVFGSVNPVASSHFNFTTPEPTGVVVVLAPDEPSLLALVSLVAPVILSGNTAIVIRVRKISAARRDVRRNSGDERFARRRGEHPHRQTRRTRPAHRHAHGRERDRGRSRRF